MEWTAKEQNGKLMISVTRPMDDRGLYRAYAIGPGGSRCLLGALTPGGGCLSLRRTLSVDALRQRGCYPVRSVETALAYSFSAPAPAPPGWSAPPKALPWPDDILRAAYAAAPQRPFYQEEADGFSLAFPFRGAGPFPLPALFCFARLVPLRQQSCWLFAFDREGRPRLPAHNSPEL